MQPDKKEQPKEKTSLHSRNKHRERYNFIQLIESCTELAPFVSLNCYHDLSIDFFNPEAVKALNKSLLMRYYGIEYWDIPPTYLCPPVPGRADYIHSVADLLASSNHGNIPTGNSIKCLDIGIGANCIYPIIGAKEYDWNFVGSEIDPTSIASAQSIVELNHSLHGKIEIRLQPNQYDLFQGIIQPNEHFDLTICNPPFHSSQAEAQKVNLRKLSNLKQKHISKPAQNFGGQSNELWCDGGEEKFVANMIHQSKLFAVSCLWFSTLISKESNLNKVYSTLRKIKATEVKTIPMGQGNKISRIVAWTFHTPEQQKEWVNSRWK